GLRDLEERTGVPTLGVLPFVHDVALDAEDSLALDGPRPVTTTPAKRDGLDIAAVRFPRLSNFTDLDALAIEPGVGVRLVTDAAGLGDPDLVVLPGTKATVADLERLRGRGDARALGTSLHGLFEEDGFRAAFLTEVGRRRGKTFVPAGVSFAAARDAQFDRLADLIEANLDLDAVFS